MLRNKLVIVPIATAVSLVAMGLPLKALQLPEVTIKRHFAARVQGELKRAVERAQNGPQTSDSVTIIQGATAALKAGTVSVLWEAGDKYCTTKFSDPSGKMNLGSYSDILKRKFRKNMIRLQGQTEVQAMSFRQFMTDVAAAKVAEKHMCPGQ